MSVADLVFLVLLSDLYDISNESLFYFLSIQAFNFVKILKEKKVR